jgi:hypothetical protein
MAICVWLDDQLKQAFLKHLDGESGCNLDGFKRGSSFAERIRLKNVAWVNSEWATLPEYFISLQSDGL